MSTSRVRHRGLPPRDIDYGPGNGAGLGSAVGADAEVARLSANAPSNLEPVGEPGGVAGAIERRQATEKSPVVAKPRGRQR